MKFAVVGLASIIPEGKGIDCLNYSLYQGLPIRGKLDSSFDDNNYLMRSLTEQLPSNYEKSLNIKFNDDVKNLDELFNKANDFFSSGGELVNVFLVHKIDKEYPHSDTPEKLCLSISYHEHQIEVGEFAVAMSFVPFQKGIEYLSLFEVLDEQSLASVVNMCDAIELASKARSVELLSQCSFNLKRQEFSVALSSAAQNFSYQVPGLDFLALMKATLQCLHRYISGVPLWDEPDPQAQWNKAFYIAEQSRSWFVSDANTPRNLLLCSDSAFVQVSDEGVGLERSSQYFAYACPHLFPIAANTLEEFLDNFLKLKKEIDICLSEIQIRRLAKQYYQNFLDAEDSIDIKAYRVAILAEDKATLKTEIELLEKNIGQLFLNLHHAHEKHEIKTPKGSYFTLEPLGEEGKVAFVFPGLGSSYTGLGQNIFQLFPQIFKESYRFTSNVGEKLRERLLYPRVIKAMTFKEKRERDMEIVSDLRDLGKTDTTYSSICAHVMTDVFKVEPDMAFGYSMGEANMMTALDVWKDPANLEVRFKQSPIFKNLLHGDMLTVRKMWGISEEVTTEQLWLTLTLKANKQQVEQVIAQKQLNRVYLTLNNTDDNIVVAGYPEECLVLVQSLACRAIPMGFVPAIHCEITAQEYEGIAELYSMPTNDNCKTKLYSSSCYLPVPVRQKAIGYAIAKCFCEPVDFPKLVEKVYSDGARIFLEAGAGRTCSTWIDKILSGKKHVIVPLNAKGTEDSLTFARVMAKLFCHKVSVDLSPLYENVI